MPACGPLRPLALAWWTRPNASNSGARRVEKGEKLAQSTTTTMQKVTAYLRRNRLSEQKSAMSGKRLACLSLSVFFVTWCSGSLAGEADSRVPEQFQEFDASSERTIDYDILTQWLKAVVVDIGRSDREKAAPTHPGIGTRIKPKIKRSTIYEGNRVYFEAFEGNDDAKQLLRDIRKSLEQLPDVAPLKYFNRSEQLAYWLNLYNVTLLNEIVSVYPKRDLEDLLVGENSILERKLLSVSGVSLSLDDIQYTILKHNYNDDPLIIYGLYQGIIGGPNIRRTAYTGKNVYCALADNALEFVNSNRGTSDGGKRSKTFNVSSFYERNSDYFPEFEADLAAHLAQFLEERVRGQLVSASTIKPNISDWTVTDLFGTYPEIHYGIATNPAALMTALRSTTPADPIDGGGGVTGAAASNGSSSYLSKAGRRSKFSPEAFKHLLVLNTKWAEANKARATVTVEDLEDEPVNSGNQTLIRDDQ
tara:strand:+ start:826 stop:2253 length:1428 start_codon:yes stop_codon:yes gene_type:complete